LVQTRFFSVAPSKNGCPCRPNVFFFALFSRIFFIREARRWVWSKIFPPSPRMAIRPGDDFLSWQFLQISPLHFFPFDQLLLRWQFTFLAFESLSFLLFLLFFSWPSPERAIPLPPRMFQAGTVLQSALKPLLSFYVPDPPPPKQMGSSPFHSGSGHVLSFPRFFFSPR